MKNVLLFTCAALAFAGCNDDDGTQTPQNATVYGSGEKTWKYAEIWQDGTFQQIELCDAVARFTFKQSGVYSRNPNPDSVCPDVDTLGTWTMIANNTKLVVATASGVDTFGITVLNENQLKYSTTEPNPNVPNGIITKAYTLIPE